MAAGINWQAGLESLDKELQEVMRVAEYEEEKAMPYVTSIEKIGRQEGRQEGRLQALREALLDLVENGFLLDSRAYSGTQRRGRSEKAVAAGRFGSDTRGVLRRTDQWPPILISTFNFQLCSRNPSPGG